MMTMDSETRIGGWTLYCDLRSSKDPSRVHTVEEVGAAVRTWSTVRALRKEPVFSKINVAKFALADFLCIVHGVSDVNLERTMQTMQELLLIIGEVLERAAFDLHINGDLMHVERQKVDRPPNIRLN